MLSFHCPPFQHGVSHDTGVMDADIKCEGNNTGSYRGAYQTNKKVKVENLHLISIHSDTSSPGTCYFIIYFS